MKKVLVMLLIMVLIGTMVQGQIDEETLENLEGQKEQLEDFVDQDDKAEYLTNEWTKFLRNTPGLNLIYKFDPFFQFLFGLKFSVSWQFFAGILVWIVLLSISYIIIKQFLGAINALVISVFITSIVSNIAMSFILEKLGTFITNIYWAMGLIVLLFLLIVLTSIIDKKVTKAFYAARQESRIRDNEKKSKVNDEMRKGYESVVAGAEGYEEGRKGK